MIVILLRSHHMFKEDRKDEEVDGERRLTKLLRTSTEIAGCLTPLVGLAAVIWQHVAAATTAKIVQDLTYGNVKAKTRTTLLVLGWLAFLWTALAIGGLRWFVTRKAYLDNQSSSSGSTSLVDD